MKWIDINDKEPESVNSVVYIFYGTIEDDQSVDQFGDSCFIGWYAGGNTAYSDLGYCRNVTHWMTAPIAP